MITLFLPLAILISVLLYFNRSKIVNYSLVIGYGILLWIFTIYQFLNPNQFELGYFKSDSLGVLLLITLSIVAIPALFHGYRYIATHDESRKSRALFFSAMTLLLTATGVAYLSNHIAVTWIFVEITTLSASVLIYHHRTPQALEGVWKYVFICAISITFVFIGILFLSLSLKQAGVDDLSFDALQKNYAQLNPFWLKLAFLFIFTGFTAKLGLVPM